MTEATVETTEITVVEIEQPDGISVVEVTIPGPQGGSGSGGGGVASLTPWTENVDAAGWNLLFDDGTGILSSEAGNPEILLFESVASAVNYLQITNSATNSGGANNNAPTVSAAGSDADVGLVFAAKGSPAFSFTSQGDVESIRFDVGAASFPGVVFRGTNSGNGGPSAIIYHDSTDPTAGDRAGFFIVVAETSVGTAQDVFYLEGFLLDATAGSFDGGCRLVVNMAGSSTQQMRMYDGVTFGTPNPTMPGTGNIGFGDLKGIFDHAANEQLLFDQVASAVNYLQIANAATATNPSFTSAGDDTNVGMTFNVKGSGSGAAGVKFNVGNSNGSNLQIIGTATGQVGPSFSMYGNSSSPADNDYIGAIRWSGNNSTGLNSEIEYASWQVRATETAAGDEDCEIAIFTIRNGTTDNLSRFRFGAGLSLGQNFPSDPGDGNIAFTSGAGVFDDNANEELLFVTTASAVNYLQIANAAAAGNPSISAAGDDTNIGMTFNVKGAGGSSGEGAVMSEPSFLFNCGTGNAHYVTFRNTSTGNAGPSFSIYQDSSSPAASDSPGALEFWGEDSAGGALAYASMWAGISDPTNASEDGTLRFYNAVAGTTYSQQMRLGPGVAIGSDPATMPGAGNLSFADAKGICDSAGARLLTFDGISSAVRSFELRNADTSYSNGWPSINAYGAEANIPMRFQAKGAPSTGFRFEAGSGAGFTQFRCNNASHGARFACSWTADNVAGGEVGTFGFLGSDDYGFSYNFGFISSINLDPTYGTGCTGGLYFASLINYTDQVEFSAFDGVTFGGTRTGPSSGVFPGRGNVQFDNGKGIKDFEGNEILMFAQSSDSPTSAANYLQVTNGANGEDPILEALGDDTNVGLQLLAKGSGKVYGHNESIIIAASDETTALTTGTAKVTFRMPYTFNLTGIRASLSTAQSSGSTFTVDVNEGVSSILSTEITIDNGQKTSTTAGTPPVISDAFLVDDAEITIDIDQVGDGTAKGLKVTLIGHQ
jgi:hypothetical protein